MGDEDDHDRPTRPRRSAIPQRADDQERDRAALALREHCAHGRLTLAELDDRIGRAYAATTREELTALLSDLPRDPAAAIESGRRHFWPGTRAFNERRRLTGSPAESYEAAMREIVPRLGAHGYHLVADVPARRMRFVGDRAAVVTVLFLPAGDSATDVCAFGDAPRAIRRAFAMLTD